ncbi:MAG TPA: L-glutamate gamma-semialdehyde dehydrogenase [Planctomycetaceae bacterium]|nr:L-glutamate gamma-semialdehyde dehydrogenase [Planctomycetaceae bacterium]HIQ20578.1 L-glutamate gamma-semialdehyde dehydrogenase [Planctomycetota bacterium]
MFNGIFRVPQPVNEPVRDYAPGTPERESLKAKLKEMLDTQVDVPMIIGGREIRNGTLGQIRCPHDHQHLLGNYHQGNAYFVEKAIQAANEAKPDWSRMPWDARAIVFLKAAELLAGRYRDVLNAATMLNVSKTPHQAEIDAACELIDFWRFNPHFMQEVYGDQPLSTKEAINYMEHRPLDGFVLAITPFNFTSIAGNLPTVPALMGNTVVWKPASAAMLPAYYIMKILEEAGLPPGVINMIPGPGPIIGPAALAHTDLGGIHFTGSTRVFSTIYLEVGSDIRKYISYPRIVGETGGKDFIFAHVSTDVDALVCALVRGAFEYQGQKCSAASRAYVPDTIWPEVKEKLLAEVADIKMGDICDFRNFMGAVIDREAFATISGYIDYAKSSPGLEILAGGGCDDSTGYFIQPTVVLSEDPKSRLMEEEIFGPVLTIYVYPETQYDETLQLCDETSPYGLTGSIFAQDRAAIVKAMDALRHAAGNFYVNDKPTGAVVGQQPFGGSRASGTNDKAGSWLNLERWVTPRTIKETLVPPTDFRYPYMADE